MKKFNSGSLLFTKFFPGQCSTVMHVSDLLYAVALGNHPRAGQYVILAPKCPVHSPSLFAADARALETKRRGIVPQPNFFLLLLVSLGSLHRNFDNKSHLS